jgi:hypothetical protein
MTSKAVKRSVLSSSPTRHRPSTSNISLNKSHTTTKILTTHAVELEHLQSELDIKELKININDDL